MRRPHLITPEVARRMLPYEGEDGTLYPGGRCAYCGGRIWPWGRVGLAYDGHSPAHLRCCSKGRMPWRLGRHAHRRASTVCALPGCGLPRHYPAGLCASHREEMEAHG